MSIARSSYLKNTTGGDFVDQKQGGTILGQSADTDITNSLTLKDSSVAQVEAGQKERGAATKIVANGEFGKMRKGNYAIKGVRSSIANLESFILSFFGKFGSGFRDAKSRNPIRLKEGLEFSTLTDSSNQISLNLSESDGEFDVVVDWGDGTKNNIKTWNDPAATHTYRVEGLKTIKVSGTLGQQMYFYNTVKDVATMRGWAGSFYRFLLFTYPETIDVIYDGVDSTFPALRAVLKTYKNQTWNTFPDMRKWDVSKVRHFDVFNFGTVIPLRITNYGNMNYSTRMDSEFNQDISGWDMSGATTLSSMFERSIFNQPIGNWNVSNVVGFSGMFSSNSKFNQDISKWNTGSATNLNGMFQNATSFNNGGSDGIRNWDTSNVEYLQSTFKGATSFNRPLNYWDTSSVISFFECFRGASSFDQDLGNWSFESADSGNSMDLVRVFAYTPFNNGGSDSIKNWRFSETPNVRLDQFLAYASSFNQPIGEWDISNVTSMDGIFYYATSFDQDVSSWDFSLAISTNQSRTVNLFSGQGGLSTENYDPLLIKLASQAQASRPKIFDMGTSTYTAGGAAEAARNTLVNTYGWTITDGGAA